MALVFEAVLVEHVCEWRPKLTGVFVRVSQPDGGRGGERLARRAAGRGAAGVPARARRAQERPLQPAGDAGHQRRSRPPQPARTQAQRTG